MSNLLDLHPKPWRFLKVMDTDGHFPHRNDTKASQEELEELDGGYSRLSNGIMDANNKCVILIDPSESEYCWAMTEEAAIALVEYVNSH